MIDEAKAKELLHVLRLIDAEQKAAKEDAKEHKGRIDELLDEALDLRSALEGTSPTLFDEQPEDVDDKPRGDELVRDIVDERERQGENAYERGAAARRAGWPESDCPFEVGSYHGVSWINGWREAEELPEEEDTKGPVL
jgi:ribosome modulation factor